MSRTLTFRHFELPPGRVSLTTAHTSNTINFTFPFPGMPSSEPAVKQHPSHQRGFVLSSPWPGILCLEVLISSAASVLHIIHILHLLLQALHKKAKVPFLEQDLKTPHLLLTFPPFQIPAEITGNFCPPLPAPFTALCQNYSAL